MRFLIGFIVLAQVSVAQNPNLQLRESSGGVWSSEPAQVSQALVFFFVGKDCPIANRYLPRLDDLRSEFAAKGVDVRAVNSNLYESPADIEAHRIRMNMVTPILLDRNQKLADHLKIDITPTAVLINPQDWSVLYAGRFDDNKAADLVKEKYLRIALEEFLARRPLTRSRTEPVGCVLERPTLTAQAGPNWVDNVAPIVHQHCVTCHRDGQVAPFSLVTYEDARRFAKTIKNVTSDRQMPPWKAATRGTFHSERVLTDDEIRILGEWADSGAPEGDKSRTPKTPEFPSSWMMGEEPDLVLTTPEYTLSASGDDVYRCYVLDPGFTTDQWVRAVEFRAGNPRVVHHILAYLDTSGRAERLDQRDPGPGYKSGGTGPGFLPAGDLSGWAPGNMPYVLPDGVARKVPKGAKIILEVHYHKSGRPEVDTSRVGVWFARKPVAKRFRTRELLNMRLKIPADESNYPVTGKFTVRDNVHLWSIMPHMHLLGRECRATVTFPDGRVQELIHIPAWDFAWQDSYHLKTPLAVPAGSKVEYTAWYNNSASNPNNPNAPPQTVRWGEQTTDEMFLCYFYYTLDAENLTRTAEAEVEGDVHEKE